MGTFHRLASSGSSSSESLYSSSSSLTDLRVDCQDALRVSPRAVCGDRVVLPPEGDGEIADEGWLGEGERDRWRSDGRRGKEGLDAFLVKALRLPLVLGSSVCWAPGPVG